MSHKWASPRNSLRVILASSSPRRQEILRDLGIDFEIRAASIEERWTREAAAHDVVRRLAKQKALEGTAEQALVIGMDTLVVTGKEKLGKPADAEDAARMLRLLSGRSHRVVGGVAVCYAGRCIVDSEETRVFFRKLRRAEIDWYVASGEPADKAGAYAIQGLGRVFIRKISGDYYNVVGFPLDAFQRALAGLGLTIYDLMPAQKAPSK
jgi:septum formation protein